MIKFCGLFSGSSGNAIFIACGQTKLLLDAGKNGKTILAAMESIGEHPAELTAILITHEHWDHICGAGVLARKYHLPVYATGGTWKGIGEKIGKVEEKRRIAINGELAIGDVTVRPFAIPHDACEPVGMNFWAENKKVTVATDIGHLHDKLLAALNGSDLLLIESNHDVPMLLKGSYPDYLKDRILGKYGHLSNETAGWAVAHALEKGTRRFLLGHLSGENNTPKLAYDAAHNLMLSMGMRPGVDVALSVAQRDRVGEVMSLLDAF